MKYFYPKYQNLHKPKLDFSDGLPGCEHLEISQRVDSVLSGLQSAYDAEVVYVDALTDKEVRGIHADDYIDFLLDISKEIIDGEEYIPSIFRNDLSESPLRFRGGMYCTEIGTPIGKESIKAALNSANTTIKAAKYLCSDSKSAFVLSRPPGHHAGVRRYGGYCFFNNAYLGVNEMLKTYSKVAVLDIDYHIGDGSVEFASSKAPYYSLNADAKTNYPYLDKRFNYDTKDVSIMNFKDKTSAQEYVSLVRHLLASAKKGGFDALVLSLGFDTLATDAYQDDKIYVEAENFREIGELFGSLDEEVLIVLEGGYDAKGLELCAEEFMSGFVSRKGL